MASPAFTAEASCYRTPRHYATRARAITPAPAIVPAQRLESTCGHCACPAGMCCKVGPFTCECTNCFAPEATVQPTYLTR